MAQQRAPLASHALEDLHVDLTPVRDRRPPVEDPSASPDLVPAPSTKLRSFNANPLPIETAFPSVAKATAKDRLVSYSVRLKLSQIERLEALKAERGIVPSELLRDFIDRCLPLLQSESV